MKSVSLVLVGVLWLGLLSVVEADAAECHQWPLREVDGRPNYDGDTIYIDLPLPSPLNHASVRVLGIDTPERKGHCDQEKTAALKASEALTEMLRTATTVEFCSPNWDKYGGRIDAAVMIDGKPLAEELIRRGLARPYHGEKRSGWCEK